LQSGNASAIKVEVEWDAAHHVAGPHAAHGIQGFPEFLGNFSLCMVSVVSGSHALHGNWSSTALQSNDVSAIMAGVEWDAAHGIQEQMFLWFVR
jgi:hypothetical protein